MPTPYRIGLGVVALLVFAWVSIKWLPKLFLPNRVIVRNASGQELRDVHLVLSDLDGQAFLSEDVSSIGPGDSLVFYHGRNDLQSNLRFLLAGDAHHHETPYIDLWRGEGWMLEVLSDGTVKANYESVLSSNVEAMD